jgi:tripartite ATP-independent transporter DctM subunit
MMELVSNHAGTVCLVIVALALFGAPIFACMAALAAVGLAAGTDFTPAKFLVDEFGLFTAYFGNGLINVQALATGQTASTLSTIPLFTFAGYVMAESQTATRMVRFSQSLVGWIPGGMALVTIVACAIFTTFTGASGVTIVAIGGLLMPSLLKAGYRERFSLGLVTSTGSIGLLFPPALPLIVYGIVYGLVAQTSMDSDSAEMALSSFDVERFLFAGILPGVVLISIFGAYAVFVAIRQRVPRTKFDAREARRAAVEALPELLIPILIIGTLATGFLQIPEAAAMTALYVLLVEALWYRDIKVKDLPKVARESLAMVGAIFLIIVAATVLTNFFLNANVGTAPDGTTLNVPDWLYSKMSEYIRPVETPFGTIPEKAVFLFYLNILLLIVGCLMDIFSAIVVVVPLIAHAAVNSYGIDPYHLGVIFLLNLEIGYITPPVGLNLFIASIRFGKPMWTVVRAVLPFLGLMLFALLLVTYIPALTPVKAKTRKLAAEQPAQVLDGDGGIPMAKQITHPDGGVWEPSRCDGLEDPLEKLECQNMFQLWPRCQAMEDPLDKLECEQKVLEGEDPFEADAGGEEGEEGEEADAGPDGGAGPDAAP